MRSESEMKEIVGHVGKYMVDRGVFDPLRAWKNVLWSNWMHFLIFKTIVVALVYSSEVSSRMQLPKLMVSLAIHDFSEILNLQLHYMEKLKKIIISKMIC